MLIIGTSLYCIKLFAYFIALISTGLVVLRLITTNTAMELIVYYKSLKISAE